MTSNKRLDIELMRVIAAFFVIFNHTNDKGFFLFSLCDARSLKYWIYLFISVFCKLSVPLFFMIAGALLLDRRDETLKKLWLHRVLHFAIVLVFWSFFYYVVEVRHGNEMFNIFHFLSKLYDSNWTTPLWYLYAYIAFLISLPLLRRFAQSLTDREYIYIYIIYIIFQMIIPSAQYLLFQGRHSLNGNVSIAWLASNIVIFPLTGYFLSFRRSDFWNVKRITVLWIVDIATILLSSYLTYYRAQIMGVCDESHSQAFHSTFVLINSTAVFATCQYMNEHTKLLEKMSKPLTSLGGCTFGVYLLHVYIKNHASGYLWDILRERMNVPTMLYAFILCGAVFACGYVITLILKRIPLLRRMVS